uniref:RNA-directed DNA polymerase n=1 Tax=Panagrolaimus sp. ES5 TaxID=591445 RepID=A0AC34FQP6_9BILA
MTAAQNAPPPPIPVAAIPQAPTPSSCVLPVFTLNTANPHFTKSWFEQVEIILQLHTQNDDDKVKLVIASLDTSTFDKVRRALLPETIKDLANFPKLKKKMIKFFDAEESLFAHRFAAFQVEWGGPDRESVREYEARIKSNMESFEADQFGENEIATLYFVMGIKARALEPLRTMSVDALRKNPKIPLKGLAEMVAASLLTRQEQRLPEGASSQVNFVKQAGRRMKPKHADYSSNKGNNSPCASCGGNHARTSCRFKDAECRLCKKIGHIAKVCRSSNKKELKVTLQSKTTSASNRPSIGSVEANFGSMQIAAVATQPLPSRMMLNLECNNVQIRGQLDWGSDITIMSKRDYQSVGSPPLTVPEFNTTLANGNNFWILGAFIKDVTICGQQKQVKLHVADSRVTLLGLDLFDTFKLRDVPLNDIPCNMVSDNVMVTKPVIDKLLQDFKPLFKEGVGKCTKKKIKFHLKQGARPVHIPARRLSPFAMEEAKAEFQRLEAENIGYFVPTSPWASPFSMVPKKDGKRRLVVDNSIGLNDQLEEPGYMIPTPTDLFDKLAGCSVFSLLDMSQAYHQMELEEESKVLTTVSTPFGLFRYNTQPFGTKNAPGDFQQTMDEMLNEKPSLHHSGSYFDDIAVGSKTVEDHHIHLRQTLQRFLDWGFRLNFNKCKFYRSSIKFLGKIVDCNGIRPDPEKVAAIQRMASPTDVSALRTFLGMVNYYQEFIPKMRELREPLDNLLKSDADWEQNAAVAAIKEKLTQECLLTHYDPRLPITVAADASQHGIGGVISHIYQNGKEKPIQFFSRALNVTQQRYNQTEKEALALITAVKTFHRYLEGRKFTLLTDHKALLALFGNKKGKPVLAMNRLHRWSLFLAAYNFDIQYSNTSKFGQADALSRLIVATKALPELFEEDEDNDFLNDAGLQQVMVSVVQMLPVTSEDIIVAYAEDEEAQIILGQVTETTSADEKFYLVHKVIMMNNRVFIPQILRQRILDHLHLGHPGVNRMKALARQHVYWKNITKDVEAVVNQCYGCIQLQKNPVKATLASWPVSIKPGDRVHMDFAGPIL